VIKPSSDITELLEAETGLSEMQLEIRNSLAQKARLASLGEAVSKVNHDLRNMLTTAQLMADRMEGSKDPIVARMAPKLIAALERGTKLCESTLQYGKAEEILPDKQSTNLEKVVTDISEAEGFTEDSNVQLKLDITENTNLYVDPDHLYRVLQNIIRNAKQAIEGDKRPNIQGKGSITISNSFCTKADSSCIHLIDTGPGLPPNAMENLFKPFMGGVRRGGTGLGLAISRELTLANSGSLELVSSDSTGTKFLLEFPKSK